MLCFHGCPCHTYSSVQKKNNTNKDILFILHEYFINMLLTQKRGRKRDSLEDYQRVIQIYLLSF